MDFINNVKMLKECALFGFPFNLEEIEIHNYCILYQILHLNRNVDRKQQT